MCFFRDSITIYLYCWDVTCSLWLLIRQQITNLISSKSNECISRWRGSKIICPIANHHQFLISKSFLQTIYHIGFSDLKKFTMIKSNSSPQRGLCLLTEVSTLRYCPIASKWKELAKTFSLKIWWIWRFVRIMRLNIYLEIWFIK